jgi:hypothetical protein
MSTEENDLRSQLQSAFKESTAEPAETPAAVTPPTEKVDVKPAEGAAQPSRDEQGRFAKAEKPSHQNTLAKTPPAAKPATDKPAAAAAPDTPAAAVTPPVDKPAEGEQKQEPPGAAKVAAPPIGWSAEAKAKWHELPAEVSAAIAKREQDVAKLSGKMDEERGFGREMQRVVQPYLAQIQAEGGTPAGAVQSLLNTAYVLRTGAPDQKRNALLSVARHYGVDLGTPNSSPDATNQSPPELRALQQQVAQLQGVLNQGQQAQAQATHQQALQEVEAFAADPANAYFDEVKADVAALLKGGRATGLKEAYDMACWARPDVRTTILAQQRAEDEQKRTQAERTRVEEARRKAVSVVGSPGSPSLPSTAKPAADLRTELANQFAAARSAV